MKNTEFETPEKINLRLKQRSLIEIINFKKLIYKNIPLFYFVSFCGFLFGNFGLYFMGIQMLHHQINGEDERHLKKYPFDIF